MACSEHPRFVLKANGGPNARADAGGTSTHPRSAALHPIKPSRPTRAARASHCIYLPRGGNTLVGKLEALNLDVAKASRSTTPKSGPEQALGLNQRGRAASGNSI
jgi:hypothetical protein